MSELPELRKRCFLAKKKAEVSGIPSWIAAMDFIKNALDQLAIHHHPTELASLCDEAISLMEKKVS